MDGLRTLLEAFAEEGTTPRYFREGMLAEFGSKEGGCLTEADLDVVPIVTTPARHQLGDVELFGSPRLGSQLLALIGSSLDASVQLGPLDQMPDERARVRVHAEDAEVWFEAPGFDSGPIAQRLKREFDTVLPFPEEPSSLGVCTRHPCRQGRVARVLEAPGSPFTSWAIKPSPLRSVSIYE